MTTVLNWIEIHDKTDYPKPGMQVIYITKNGRAEIGEVDGDADQIFTSQDYDDLEKVKMWAEFKNP